MKFGHKIETLKNGLRVVTVPMASPTVTVLAMVRVGSRDEDPKKGGISHFVEHLVFKGTKKYPTPMSIAAAVDAVGASFNAFTSKEYTGFYVKSASEHMELSLDIISQFLFAAKLRADDIEREKGVIVEEINMYEDTPMRRVGDLFDQLVYEGHELGNDIIGTKKTVTGVDRADFVAHMKKWYRPENIVLGIAGDASKLQATGNKAQDYFGEVKAGKVGNPGTSREFRTGFGKIGKSGARVRVHYKKTEQAHFALGSLSLPRGHKDRYVQSVLATILGGNMSSRLFSEVREKRGLAYYVRTGVETYDGTGNLVTQAGVTVAKIEEAVNAILKEYQKIQDSRFKIQEKELKKAKEYLKGKLKIDLEDSQDVAHNYVDSLLLEGKVRTPQEIIKGVEAVTGADVVRLAREILKPEKMNLVVIGPYKQAAQFEKLLA